MFVLEDGRKNLFQWDVNRRLIVEDPTINEVHFCNKTGDCSLVVTTYTEDDKVYADIPNVLLQDRWDIRAYAYCGTGYTKVEEVFEVKARTKPTDYVYTETEIKRYEDLSNRIDEIEKNGISQEAINTAVEVYLEENPIGDIPTKVSEFENDAGYATESYVDDAIAQAKLEGEDIDLSDYAKKSDIPDVSDFISEIPAEYITETELNAKGYLTEHQSLNDYATKTYVDEAIAKIELPEAAQGCDLEFIDYTATGVEIKAILDAGKWPVFRYASTYSIYHLPLVDDGFYYYNFGGVIGDRRYTLRYSKELNRWEGREPSIDYFLDESEVVANPTAEATETLTKLTIRGTTYSFDVGSGEVVDTSDSIAFVDKTTTGAEVTALLEAGKWPVYRDFIIPTWLFYPLTDSGSNLYYFEKADAKGILRLTLHKTTNEWTGPTRIAYEGGSGGSGGTTVTVGGEAQETWNADNKRDIISKTSTEGVVYWVNPGGTQGYKYANTGTSGTASIGNTLALRTSTGTLKAAEPTSATDLTTKKYVDNAIQNALSGIAQAEGGAY